MMSQLEAVDDQLKATLARPPNVNFSSEASSEDYKLLPTTLQCRESSSNSPLRYYEQMRKRKSSSSSRVSQAAMNDSVHFAVEGKRAITYQVMA